MTVSFQLDDDLARQLQPYLGDMNRAARDALLIEAYRVGKLSVGQLARTLGIGAIEADQWLARHGVPLNYTLEDFQADREALRDLHRATSR